jgi:hypothetical protein
MEIKKVVVREEEAKNRERQTIEKRPTRREPPSGDF